MSRLLILAALAVALGGCLAGHPRLGEPAETPVFRPEVFFDGATRGEGTLAIRTRGTQTVRVESQGDALPDGSFRLVQTIRLGDDPPSDRTWTFRRTASGYAATLTEARGPVQVEVAGNDLHIYYKTGRFTSIEQTLRLQPGGDVALNQLTARMMGIPVARISERIEKAR